MLFYNSNSRNVAEISLDICLNILTLSVLFRPGYALISWAEDLAPVIPLHDEVEHTNQCTKTCHTAICGDEALRFIKLMNDQVDPCDNFYEFVCGTYIRDTPMEETDNAISIVNNIQSEITNEVFADVSEEIKESDLDAFKKMKMYYQNCLNEQRIEEAGTKPLLSILNSIGGWPILLGNRWNEKRFDLMQSLYKLKEQKIPAFFPVVLAVDLDNIDSSKYAIKLQNANFNVNGAWFTDNDRNRVAKSFLNMLVKVATILGARNDSTTLREMQQVTDFEINLFNIATPAEKLVDLPVERSRVTIQELSYKYPSIPWLDFINKILNPAGVSVNEEEYVYVVDPDFISKVVKLIERTPKRVLANFIAWRTAQVTLSYMPKEMSSAGNDYESVLDGTNGEQDRASICYNEIQEMFTVGLSAMYIKKHFKESIQEQIAEMFENVKQQARTNLQQNDWMDETTRRIAMEKLDAMTVTIGYAKELTDERKINEFYRELEINPGLLIESAFNTSFFTEQKSNKKLRRPTGEDQWTTKQSVVELNAYNVFQENSIELPAGFLKYLFKSNRPQYINYGIAAAFIGHEVFHGFDNQGKQYDKHGNQVNWWQQETEEKFKQKAQCIIAQYSNFTVPEVNMQVNGELSQGENIADNGGFRAAYLAYNEWTKRHNTIESCLPSLNYTPQQMFWISSASIWCAKERPEYVRGSMATDEHSPNIARVIVTFSNIKEFSDDFKCKLGSKMNPHKRCQIW